GKTSSYLLSERDTRQTELIGLQVAPDTENKHSTKIISKKTKDLSSFSTIFPDRHLGAKTFVDSTDKKDRSRDI
ncbi:MAG: hypothetical protein K0R98_2033, partial [Rickettsiaceae bacterium]|nr:hypothetical protein [Rickettsiaceae bacterium]